LIFSMVFPSFSTSFFDSHRFNSVAARSWNSARGASCHLVDLDLGVVSMAAVVPGSPPGWKISTIPKWCRFMALDFSYYLLGCPQMMAFINACICNSRGILWRVPSTCSKYEGKKSWDSLYELCSWTFRGNPIPLVNQFPTRSSFRA
jgi:hypothetical protein